VYPYTVPGVRIPPHPPLTAPSRSRPGAELSWIADEAGVVRFVFGCLSLPEAAHDSERLLVFSSAAAHKAAGRIETMTTPTQPLHRVLSDPVAPWPHLSPEAPFRSTRAPKFQRKIIFTRSSRERGELFENHGTPRRCAPVLAGIPLDLRFAASTHRRCAATAIGSTRGVR
jgi:hypothetical protein